MQLSSWIAGAIVAVPGCVILQVEDHDRNWDHCNRTSDCIVVSNSCCDACGEPTLAQVDAVNRFRVDDQRDDVCPDPVPCPKCASQDNPDLLATCAAERCQAVDIRTHAVSSCALDTDCKLRVSGCCECGGSTLPEALIAINASLETAYRELACDAGQACAECAPVYPTEVEAHCAPDGHCAVRQTTSRQ
jgi:hypothetical protein